MSETFEFIREYRNIYENATYTEQLLESATSVLELGSYENQMRKTAETMINKLISEFNVKCESRLDLRGKIDLLYERGIIDRPSKDNYHTMRMEGNPGSHAHETMDTHSAQNYYKEKREKDENAFKRLFVECHAFVEVYMPKVNGGSNTYTDSSNSASTSTPSSASYQAKPQSTNTGSSVKYGSAQNSNVFMVKKGGNRNTYMMIILIPMCILLVPIISIYISLINGTDTMKQFAWTFIYMFIFVLWGFVCRAYYVKVERNSYGILNFCSHKLEIGGGTGCRVDDMPIPVTSQQLTAIRKDGKKATLAFDHKTSDGFDIYVYLYMKSGYWKYDIYINELLIVEGDYIDLDNLRKLENGMR